jgi:hypothetical protein
MKLRIETELASLKRLTVDQLRVRYVEVFDEPTGARHKEWLIKRIAWRLQAHAEGGLSERARRRAMDLARESDLRLSPPKPAAVSHTSVILGAATVEHARLDRRLPIAGTIITRPYKGQSLQVKVLADGFEFEGEHFESLSGLAKHITGAHCNGYQFFRLTRPGGSA